jgi:hypothetical protein
VSFKPKHNYFPNLSNDKQFYLLCLKPTPKLLIHTVEYADTLLATFGIVTANFFVIFVSFVLLCFVSLAVFEHYLVKTKINENAVLVTLVSTDYTLCKPELEF